MKKQTLICDRCKEEIEEKSNVLEFNGKNFDLCEECTEEFKEFMEIKDDERGFI